MLADDVRRPAGQILALEEHAAGARPQEAEQIERTVVVLPMPLRPSMATTSPARNARSTPNSTCASSYPASRPSTSQHHAAPSSPR